MTRIEVVGSWYITGETLDSILNKYYTALLKPTDLFCFVDTNNRDVNVRPESVVAIIGDDDSVPAEENNSD